MKRKKDQKVEPADSLEFLRDEPSETEKEKKENAVDWNRLLDELNGEKHILEYSTGREVFRQGDPADSVVYLRKGSIKLTVISPEGKEAIVSLVEKNQFFGEGCLAGQPLRIATAVTLTDCTLVKISKRTMAEMLNEKHAISELFARHLLTKYIRFEGDLIDQLFNSSEKRLARILLLLSHFGQETTTAPIRVNINQEHLSQMVGTTRSRISHFMNKFRDLGFVEYDKVGEVTVHSGLLSVIVHD